MLPRRRDYSPGRTCFGAEPGVAAGDALVLKTATSSDPRGPCNHRRGVWQRRRTRHGIVRTRCFVGAEIAGRPSEIARTPDLPEQTNPNTPEIPASGRGPGARGRTGRCNRRGSGWRVERAGVERNTHDREWPVYDRPGAVFSARLRRHLLATACRDPAAV